ncbi:MAG: ABC transporter substrate-binding protein [Candidatus Acidiferrales bacterium]
MLVAVAALILTTCAPSPRDDNTIVFLIETMPANLDPRIGTDAQSQRLHSLIFSSLLERDDNMNLRGDLASRWESPDPLTYIFHLRKDAYFHDGRALTAADVKYTFDSILNGDVRTPKRGAFRMVESVTAPDDFTIVFRLSEPFASFLWNLARPSVGIVPRPDTSGRHPRNADENPAAHPIGTGPFRFISSRQDEEVILERVSHRGLEGLAGRGSHTNSSLASQARSSTTSTISLNSMTAPLRVRFRIVPDATVRALELRKGTADIALNSINPDTVPALAKEGHIALTQRAGTTYAYLAFNFDDPLLARREVRQALAYATDRATLIKHLLNGQARPADSLLPPYHWAYAPAPPEFSYAYDPARAAALLDTAGYRLPPDGSGPRLRLTLKVSTDETSRLVAAVLQEQWRRVGIELEIRPLEFATLFSDIGRGSFQIYFLRWVGANSDPDIFEYVFHSKKMPPNGANRGHYRNPRLDSLLDRARIEHNRDQRIRLYAEVQRIIAEDLPYLSLWYPDNVCLHSSRIGQVQLTPPGDYDFVKEIVLQ